MILHTDEVEILLPERMSEPDKQPFFLTVGPSFTMLLPILLMALLGSRIYGDTGNRFIHMTLITGGTSALLGIFWAVSNRVYRDRNREKTNLRKREEFRRYLRDMDGYLNSCAEDNRAYLKDRYPDADVLLHLEKERLFFRNRYAADRYLLRIGLGTAPFQMNVHLSEKVKQMFPDEDVRLAGELVRKYGTISDVPILLDLTAEKVWGILGDPTRVRTYEYLTRILVQLCAALSPRDLKIVLFYDKDNPHQKRLYEACKFLPHCFARGRRLRLCAGNREESTYLWGELLSMKLPAVWFILHDAYLDGEALFPGTEEGEEDLLRSVFFLKGKKEELPDACSGILKLPEEGHQEASLIIREKKSVLIPDHGKRYPGELFLKGLSVLLDREEEHDRGIPEQVPFPALYDCIRIEEIQSAARYRENRTDISLRVPLGMGEGNKKLYLDLHEKFHGPHGLVAGTTGSGKSELLQTYLISLCLSFSPEDVNFFLIDYKGGGTGNHIRDLPHSSGVISNLSGNSIKRALLAIGSENRRRQALFSSFGITHIDAYTKLRREKRDMEPLPHLLLIIDEFAELKSEEPDFMQQIISLSAVGRSLGIHLILATQKPAGVVDEKIFSNSRFRLCLKVQDRQDSMDMLKRPEGALLTRPGQCYLQIGNNEMFREFQTGYCGGRYRPEGEEGPGVCLVTGSGRRISVRERDPGQETLSLLPELVRYVNKTVDEEGLSHARALWMEELPESVPGIHLRDPESVYLGRYDHPGKQEQGDMYYHPGRGNHLAVVGGPASGKSRVLHTILSQIMDPFLLIDLMQNSIFAYAEDPLCMGTLREKEEEEVFFYHLERVFQKRKDSPEEGKTRLFVVIDNFAAFFKTLSESHGELIGRMVTEGSNRNICFLITASSASEIPSRIFGKIRTTMALWMSDRLMYGDILRQYHLNVYPKPDTPGRCLYRIGEEILEGQVALYEKRESPENDIRVGKFPKIPRPADAPAFKEAFCRTKTDPRMLPVGWSLRSGRLRMIDMTKRRFFLVIAGDRTAAEDYIRCLLTVKEDLAVIPDLSDYLRGGHVLPEQGFTLLVCHPGNDTDLLLLPEFRKIAEEDCGMVMGMSPASQRILGFDDLPYSLQTKTLRSREAYVRLGDHGESLRACLPCRERSDEEEDDDDRYFVSAS